MGRPRASVTTCNFEFMPPLVRPMNRPVLTPHPPFYPAGWRQSDVPSDGSRRSDRLGILPLGGHHREHPGKHPQPAPAHPSAIERLRWAICRRRILPAQPIAIYEDNSTQHTLVIHPRNPVRQRKKRPQPLYLCIRQPEKITQVAPPWIPKVNQTIAEKASALTGTDPTCLIPRFDGPILAFEWI